MVNQSSTYKKFVVGLASAALVTSIVAPVVSAAGFSDTKGNTHEEAINALAEAGIIKGYEDGSFQPKKTLTRSDVVKLMGKWLVAEGKEIPKDARTKPRFTDLKTTSNGELLDYAAVVKDNHVFNGNEGKLLATDNITRENMAVVIVRALDQVHNIDLVSYVAAQDFKRDVTDLTKAKPEARSAIDVFDYFDITNPTVPSFNPKDITTRGHFSTFLYKSIGSSPDFPSSKDDEVVEDVDKLAVEAGATQVKNGVIEVLRGENATNENKRVAVQAYVTSLVTEKDVSATVVVGKTAHDYVVTLTKGEAKAEKSIVVAFEMTAKDLFVTTVNAISTTGTELTFKATPADNIVANVVVKDHEDNVVPTTSKVVAEGAKKTTIEFVTPFSADYKFTGIWTVNGVEYSFDAINQLKEIITAADLNNQILLQAALDDAKITVSDKSKIAEYLTAIKEGNPNSLAAVQKIINEIDEEANDVAADTAAVKAVVDATTQQQLLNALKNNFKLVNDDWIVDYAEKDNLLTLKEDSAITFSEIQSIIYTVNNAAIALANQISTSVEQANVSDLIEAWMKADSNNETVKAKAFTASKVKESAFKVAEANTPNTLFNALTNYASLAADEKYPTTLQTSELNLALKEFYFAELDQESLVAAVEGGTANIKGTLVTSADKAAVAEAMETIKKAYEAINKAEETAGKSTTMQKNALKTALQKLATVTSHKTVEFKFNTAIIADQHLVAYAKEFAQATVINEKSTVAAVVADITAVNKAIK